MHLSVIIPALNEEESLPVVLTQLPWSILHQVIVVDNGSQDRTAEVAAATGASVVHEPRRGYGSACMAGVRAAAEADILIFLDADRASLPTYLDWALRLVRRGGLIVADNTLCGGRVIAEPADEGDDVRAVREFNQRVASDPRLTSILIPAYDGLVVALAEGNR